MQVRFHSVAALNAGLSVQIQRRVPTGYYPEKVPKPLITWTGTKEQFVATGLFCATVLERIVHGRGYWVNGISGQVNRLGENDFEFIVQGGRMRSKMQVTRQQRVALADEAFLNFRDKVMAGFPREDLGCES